MLCCNSVLPMSAIIVEHISNWKIIVQQVQHYSKIPYVCIYMSAKISVLLIVGLKLVLRLVLHRRPALSVIFIGFFHR